MMTVRSLLRGTGRAHGDEMITEKQCKKKNTHKTPRAAGKMGTSGSMLQRKNGRSGELAAQTVRR